MPFLSFIVGFRNREYERVKLFLESLSFQSDKDFEVIFVDYGSDSDLSSRIEPLITKYDFAKYFFYNSRGQNWNRAKCLNYAFKKSKAEYIFTTDIDFIFNKNFVSLLKKNSSQDMARYYSFGYLSKKYSKDIDFNKPFHPTNEYSSIDTIGALLISKKMFIGINGFDEFYEIWGLEDNDILKRIQISNYSIEFCADRNLIWHIWHLPAKKTDILPEGWLQFLGDYFKDKFNNIHTQNKNHICVIDESRPIISKFNKATCINNISYNTNYLQEYLKSKIIEAKSDEVICFKFNDHEYQKYYNSSLNKLIRHINKTFNRFNLPLIISNKNMIQFISQKQIRDTLQYFIKYNQKLIKDYYLCQDLEKDGLYVMKR